MEIKMREMVLCIVVALSLTTPYYGYSTTNSGTTHLVGRDSLCLDIAPFVENYGSFLLLSPCKQSKHSQLWSIMDDGTIRTVNNRFCLVPERRSTMLNLGTDVILKECSKESEYNKKWIKNKDGSILHVESGLVLTGKAGARYVRVERNEDVPSQSWEATENFMPTVGNIKWLDNLCLRGRGEESVVFLNECSRDDMGQRWLFYGDGTIRQSGNRNYCLTSESLVVVSKCGDKAQQRWGLAEDNTISHPSTNLVIDVNRDVPSLQPLIFVDKRDGSATQKWTIIY